MDPLLMPFLAGQRHAELIREAEAWRRQSATGRRRRGAGWLAQHLSSLRVRLAATGEPTAAGCCA